MTKLDHSTTELDLTTSMKPSPIARSQFVPSWFRLQMAQADHSDVHLELHLGYNSYPLVVFQLEALPSVFSFRQALVKRNVIGVGYPTNVVYVLFVVAREIGRYPAVYLFGTKLTIGHYDGKYDQDGHCVLVVDSIGKVVIVSLDSENEYGNSCNHT